MALRWIDREEEWQALTAGDVPLQQAWDYGCAMARLGAGVRRAALPCGPVQMLERRGLRVVNRPAVSRAGLRRLARHAGATLATAALAGPGLVPLLTARFHAEWDLTPEPAALRAGLQGKWRNRMLRGFDMAPPCVGDRVQAMAIAQAAAAQAQARGYRMLPPAFLQAWGGDSLVLHWSPGGDLAAGIVVLIHGARASYHCGFSDARGRAAHAHAAMLWQAALALRDRGVRRLDLGAVDAANPGLARFKLGTGAQINGLGPSSLVLPL